MTRTTRLVGLVAIVFATGALNSLPASAADVTNPQQVQGLACALSAPDVALSWSPVTTDAAGNPESVSKYRVYRGTTPDFVPDVVNRIGEPTTTSFTDSGAASTPDAYYYLVTAVDAAGNESGSRPPQLTSPPTLTSAYTDTGIQLTWTGAQPSARVAGYRVYYGTSPHVYDYVDSVGLVTTHTLAGVASNTMWYIAVVGVDDNGADSTFSNEVVDVVAGRFSLRAHNDAGLCWLGGGQVCPPPPGAVQRNDGFQLMLPVSFPPGAWKKVTVTYTLDSRLCQVGQQGTTDKCGNTNPGGWNPCGDPWDRTALLFLVLDNCIQGGGSCITNDNLELMHAITPFGTDAPPPDGSGVVPPRVLTLDITPFTPLLTGTKYVGAEIGNYATAGWHVTVDFNFSKRPEEASSKPPAKGIQVIGFGAAPLSTRSLTVPSTATKLKMRLFVSGHGGTLYCDGGSNSGGSCTSDASCPGGTCQNCDEFCHRTNRILRNGSTAWSAVPWNACSSGCAAWDACGYPSCTYPRAGWCPGYISCHTSAPCDQDLDLTTRFPPGGTYNVGYDVLLNRGYWSVSLVAYWY